MCEAGSEASVVLKLGFTPVPMVLHPCLPCGAARRPRSLAGPPFPLGGRGVLGTDKNGSRPSRAFTGERALRSRSQLLFQNWNGPREPDC